MSINVGFADRALRIGFAMVVAALYLTGLIGGGLAMVLGVIAVVMAVTGLAGRCPAYSALGVSTSRSEAGRT